MTKFKINNYEFSFNENDLPAAGLKLETIKKSAQKLVNEQTNKNISRNYELDDDPAMIGMDPKDWWIEILD